MPSVEKCSKENFHGNHENRKSFHPQNNFFIYDNLVPGGIAAFDDCSIREY